MNIAAFALKSLWRHPTATGWRVAGLGATTAVMIVWGTLSKGFTTTLRSAATTLQLGDFQLHGPGYRRSQDFYATIDDAAALQAGLRTAGFAAAPRLYTAALAARGDQSVGARLHGIDAEAEAQVSTLHRHVDQGTWLDAAAPTGVVVGRAMAAQLQLGVGEEVVVLGHAADGSVASAVFVVRGILRPVSREVDARSLYLTIPAFRDLFLLPAGVHELVVRAPADLSPSAAARRLAAVPLPSAEVKSWRELKPALARMIDLLSITVYFTLGFTYVAVGGLTLNMMLMAVDARLREYGVMQAVGMTPRALVALVLMEAVWLAAAASALGLSLGLPVARHLESAGLDFSFLIDRVTFAGVTLGPVMRASVSPAPVVAPLLFLLVSTPLATLYPALAAARTTPVDALGRR